MGTAAQKGKGNKIIVWRHESRIRTKTSIVDRNNNTTQLGSGFTAAHYYRHHRHLPNARLTRV